MCAVAEKKSRLLAFAAEHALPYSLVPDLLQLCKVMSDNKCRSLSRIHMARQCATYSMTHGLGAAMKNELQTKLQSTFCSLNFDEATDNAMNKIVNILVRYFDGEEVKPEHFASKEVNQATAKNIHAAIIETLQERPDEDGLHRFRILPQQIVSCLMDNCATMRGVKGGVEVLLRDTNKHLLDISGDSVHTIVNAAKELFKPFEGYIEAVASDIYYDIEKSPKAKDLLLEIQSLLGTSVLHVLRPCPSRFLQMLDITERLHKLMDPLRLYYFAFLTKEEQHTVR